MRIALDETDLPEFDSFASMLIALRGAHWSVTNSDLGSDLPPEQLDVLLGAIQQIENILVPLSKEEPNNGILVVSNQPPYSTVERIEVINAIRDDQQVARVIVHDIPTLGEQREIDLTVAGAMQAAIQLLHFVQQVGNPGVFPRV